ncbi:MAG: 1-(5-phosphoribosyl)-5-[(5-phosphoribosylamino)methylideneamino]imidazole-4-carboxamide isomerase [Pseudomonadales bacterium]|nr:1-(5-phosphoribosyl)-5-[(5-phosphoribosylamino)methylideneamino]imidazole-4-carboxamide isomerase [Pseudomonadales bacterium]
MSAPLLIPAIDLKEGRCVRLRQGRMEDATVFSDDPVAVAREWERRGAARLHLVDLDGAFAGRPVNRDLVERICAALSIPVQIGGGIREASILRDYLDAGVRWGIVGTRAVREPEWAAALCAEFPDRVIVGIDAREGKVAAAGWAEATEVRAVDLARRFEDAGAVAVVYTDIDRDGMGTGVNLAETVALAEAVALPVIASGGIHDLDDLARLKEAAATARGRLLGAISGRALYEGTLDFEAGVRLLAA